MSDLYLNLELAHNELNNAITTKEIDIAIYKINIAEKQIEETRGEAINESETGLERPRTKERIFGRIRERFKRIVN